MLHRGTYHYIDELENIVSSYNNKPHRSLIGLAPNEINKDNEADVWAFVYLKKTSTGEIQAIFFFFQKMRFGSYWFRKSTFS